MESIKLTLENMRKENNHNRILSKRKYISADFIIEIVKYK